MSSIAVNQIESLNPLVDAVNIQATALTLNGNPIGGGGSPYFDDDGGTPTTAPSAAGTDSIAIGEAASVGSGATNSFSIGTNAKVISSCTDSIAIGTSAQSGFINPYSNTAIGCISIGKGSKTGNFSYYDNFNVVDAIAIGTNSNASGTFSISIGASSSASGSSSISIGNSSTNSADNCLAIGVGARGRVAMTSQIQGVSINRKDEASIVSSDVFRDFASNEAIVMTKEIDLKTLSTTTITVPTGSRFYPNEVGIILTALGGTITLQPDVSFGITGINNKFVTQTTSSLSAIYDRDVYTSLTTAGESSLTFTVNVAAAGSADIKGRAYFKGILVEVQ